LLLSIKYAALPISKKEFLIKRETYLIKVEGLALLELDGQDREFVFNLIENDLTEMAQCYCQYDELYSVDLSGCCLEGSFSEISNSLQKLGGKNSIYLLPRLNDFPEEKIAALRSAETIINNKSRSEIGENLIKKFIDGDHDRKNLLDIISPKIYQFHHEAIGSELLVTYQSNLLSSQHLKEFPSILYSSMIKQICQKFHWDIELFRKHEKIFESSKVLLDRKLKTICWMIWFAVKLSRSDYDQNSSARYQNFFDEILPRSDEHERYEESTIFFENLESCPMALNKFLEGSKRRRYTIAVILSAIFNDEKEIHFLNFFRDHKCYDEGIYQRISIKTLKYFLWNPDLSIDNKRFLLQHCCHLLKDKDKNSHFSMWGITISILMARIPDRINDYLNQCRNSNASLSLDDIYWEAFQDIFELTDMDYAQYLKSFNPTKNLHHYSLLAFRQSFSEEDDDLLNINSLKQLVKTFLLSGTFGYRLLRYDFDRNLHFSEVFKRKNAFSLKTTWEDCNYIIQVDSEKFKGSTVCVTDDIWDFLSWGDGINCLDPIGGGTKLLTHILDGRNQLVLLRDKNGQVIAGYILHLLLQGLKKTEPILAVGATYIRGNITDDEEMKIIQSLLDSVVVDKARKMAIPFVALQLNTSAVSISREVIETENSFPPLLIKQGLVQDNSCLNGVDATMVEYKKECTQIAHSGKLLPHIEISSYQYIFLPPKPQLPEKPSPILQFSNQKQLLELPILKKRSVRLQEGKKVLCEGNW